MSSTFTPQPGLRITQAGQNFQVLRKGNPPHRVSDDAAKLLMLIQDDTLSFSQVAERAVQSTTGLTRTQAQRALLELMRYDLVTQHLPKVAGPAEATRAMPPRASAKTGAFIGPSSASNAGMREVLPSVVQPASAPTPPRALRVWLRPFRKPRFVAALSLVTMFLMGIPIWAAILMPRASAQHAPVAAVTARAASGGP